MPCCSQKNKTNQIVWSDLLQSQGRTLWDLRVDLVSQTNDDHDHDENDNDTKCPFVKIPMYHKRYWDRSKNDSIAIITCPHFFQALEKEQDEIMDAKHTTVTSKIRTEQAYHGLDKPDTRGHNPRPLNACTHDEWRQTRTLVIRAFDNLPTRSLGAVRAVDLHTIFSKNTTIPHDGNIGGKNHEGKVLLDWKSAAYEMCLEWVVILFGGKEKLHDEFKLGLKEYWQVIRSETPVTEEMIAMKRKSLVKCLTPGGAGVIDSMYEVGLSEMQVNDNAINAMIAALDASQALLFWTVHNISQTDPGFAGCQSIVFDETTFNKDLEGLATFKKQATSGELADYSNLSYLGRALCETVRVFPPVWTLPRTWPQTSQLVNPSSNTWWSKLDIPIVNGANCPEDWNPENTKPSYIASFGLGRRHCPAGTAALAAVYYFLTEVIRRVEHIEYYNKEHDAPSNLTNPIDCARLLPTLSLGSIYNSFYFVKYTNGTTKEVTDHKSEVKSDKASYTTTNSPK